MLKRCQILLEDWQLEHLRLIAEKNDLSISEMIRVILCEGLMHTAPYLYPELKSKIADEKDVLKITLEGVDSKTTTERKHQLVSKLYFETRKALEQMNKILQEKTK